MKRTLTIVALALLVGSCTSEERQIERNAYGYLDAMGNYLIDQAEPYASEATRNSTIVIVRDKIMPRVDKELIRANTPATISIDSLRILCADTAMVYYTMATPLSTKHDFLPMVKEDGQWLAYMPLNTTNDPADGETPDNNAADAQ